MMCDVGAADCGNKCGPESVYVCVIRNELAVIEALHSDTLSPLNGLMFVALGLLAFLNSVQVALCI